MWVKRTAGEPGLFLQPERPQECLMEVPDQRAGGASSSGVGRGVREQPEPLAPAWSPAWLGGMASVRLLGELLGLCRSWLGYAPWACSSWKPLPAPLLHSQAHATRLKKQATERAEGGAHPMNPQLR